MKNYIINFVKNFKKELHKNLRPFLECFINIINNNRSTNFINYKIIYLFGVYSIKQSQKDSIIYHINLNFI